MLGNFFESFAPRLLPTLHSALKNQCLRYPSGSAHVAAGLSESADPQVRRVARPFETFLSETKQNGSLEKQYWGPGGWGSYWLRWLTGDLHFCCYLLCFLHGRPPRRPGPLNATAEPVPCAET